MSITTKKLTNKLLLSLALTLCAPLQAQQLGIPGHYDSGETISMPQRGISMNRVLDEYGEPHRRSEAVGNPPITEWDYGDFRVFFEHQTVLHSLNLNTLIMPR